MNPKYKGKATKTLKCNCNCITVLTTKKIKTEVINDKKQPSAYSSHCLKLVEIRNKKSKSK